MSVSVTEIQTMVDICVDELRGLDMVLNPGKCCIMRVGYRYDSMCCAIKINNQDVPYCHSAKYLGVRLCSKKRLVVDLKSMKTKFYAAFNGLFHRAAKMKDKLTVLHLVSAYCKPYLLYGTECFTSTVTQSRSLCHAWLTAVSHIFNVSGTDVNFINAVTCMPNETIDATLSLRRIRILQ